MMEDKKMQVEFLKLLYETMGFEGLKDFVLFAMNEQREKYKTVFPIVLVFQNAKEIINQEDKTAYNALVKVWLDELEKELRLE